MDCYETKEMEGINEVGSVVTAASHSCAHTSNSNQHLWLICIVLIHLQRRRTNND